MENYQRSKRLQKCGLLVFKKVLVEKVSIVNVGYFNKKGASTGGTWEEKQEEEHKVTYHCDSCGTELK